MLQTLLDFFDQPVFVVFGGIFLIPSLLSVVIALYTGFLFSKGIAQVLYRLGRALSRREIAIFTTSEYGSLSNMIIQSGLFKKNNIDQIFPNTLTDASDKTIFLVHWKDFKDKLSAILNMKKSDTALIIYAPRNEGPIDDTSMDLINSHPNAIIVNLRGRLLNDIYTSMVTTRYSKK